MKDCTKKKIALLLKSRGGMRFSEIIKEVGYKEKSVSRTMSYLVMNKIVYCDFLRCNKSKVRIKPAGIDAFKMLYDLKIATFNGNFRRSMKAKKPTLEDARKALELYFPHSRSYKKHYGPLMDGQNL